MPSMRRTVACNRESFPIRGKSCFGYFSRERGQRRVPDPPDSTTGINDQNSTVGSLHVFPNPATSSAEIKFTLVKSSSVSIELFNLEGQMMKNIYSGKLAAGENKMQLDVTGYASGMYLIKLTDGVKSKFINLVVSH